jgi:hypothetical protein
VPSACKCSPQRSPSPHRCAARGWRELLRALEHERCLGLGPLIALDAAVTTAAAMAAAADAHAGTTDARSVNAGASDARSVNRTHAAVGSGRTESHSDVGIGLRLAHSDVGIGLIFSEATSLWESLRLLDAHDDAHDDDAHDDAAAAHDDDDDDDDDVDDDVAVAEAADRSSDAARPAKEAKKARKARAAMVPAWAKGIATAWRLDPWEGPQFPIGAVPSVGHGRMRLKMRRDFAPSSHVLASLDRSASSASSASSEKPRPPPPPPPPPPPSVVALPEVGPEENDSEEEEEEEEEEGDGSEEEEEEGARDGASEAVARDSNPKSDLTNPKRDLGRAGSMFGSVVPSAEERLSNDAWDDAPLAARDDARVPLERRPSFSSARDDALGRRPSFSSARDDALGRRPSFSSARDDAPLAARDDALERRRPSVVSRSSSDQLDVADGMHAEAVNVPNAPATSAGTTSAAPGTSFSGTASASAAPAPWLAWLSISSNAPELAPAQHGAVEQGPVKAKALETALEANTQTRHVALDTALGSPPDAPSRAPPDAPSRAPPDGAKLSAMARRSFVVDGPLLLSARCHLVRDCT